MHNLRVILNLDCRPLINSHTEHLTLRKHLFSFINVVIIIVKIEENENNLV